MKDKSAGARTGQKPCVCRVFSRARLVWKPTGRKDAEGQSEFKCSICGATTWRQA